jgi:hypothetical protein
LPTVALAKVGLLANSSYGWQATRRGLLVKNRSSASFASWGPIAPLRFGRMSFTIGEGTRELDAIMSSGSAIHTRLVERCCCVHVR